MYYVFVYKIGIIFINKLTKNMYMNINGIISKNIYKTPKTKWPSA